MRLLRRRISCQELALLASDYLDDRLDARTRSAVDRHLADCPNCPHYVAQLRLVVAQAGRLRVDDLPPELLEVLMRAWEDAHPSDG